MIEPIYLLRVFYPDDNPFEDIIGILDKDKKLIRVIEISDEFSKGYKEKGLINLDFVKKVDMIKKVGCLSSDEFEVCEID